MLYNIFYIKSQKNHKVHSCKIRVESFWANNSWKIFEIEGKFDIIQKIRKRGAYKMANELSLVDENINPIFEEIKDLVNTSRNKVYSTVNTEMLKLYWNIGKIIMEIQQGNERASYGKSVLENLSKKLTNEFGKGFSVDNLEKMRKFYNVFPNSETLSRKFKLVSLFGIDKN